MTATMHPIPVRTMGFVAPAEFHPLYIAGNAVLSYSHTAIGLYLAYLEPFFVKSLHRVMDRITDPVLLENVDRFCRQETQHYKQHVVFNRLVLTQGYGGLDARVEKLRNEFEGSLRNRDDRFRIGYVEGFESYTTQFALQVMG